RTSEQVRAAPERVWRPDRPAARAAVPTTPPAADEEELRQLDALQSGGVWHVYGRDLRVSNLDKVLFPPRPGQAPVTKRELLRYTARIAPTVLPYLARRALTMHRFPDGAAAEGFWQ